MVDKESLANSGPRMNLNACQEPTDVRKKTSQELEPVMPQEVGETVEPEGVEARIEKDDLQLAPRCGVFGENRSDIHVLNTILPLL